ncbi:ERF family protein [Microbacterium sp. MYb64]|uniref:ERF family protein n=1 Tax=Microbacterium sp. MYb64 TaxID=1848691 RepID=UPI0015E39E08|nr:ERF family protein [Microbacterium sp. MYb64]
MSTTHANLAEALAAFQAELPTIAKGNTAKVPTKNGGEYKYSYADLKDVSEVVLPLLGRHGLAWTAQPTLVGEHFVLRYALMHESTDQGIEGLYPLPDPAQTPPQSLGSAITYARRYTLCSVTGIAPGGDDDDAQAANSAPAGRARAPRQAPPREPLPAPIVKHDWAAEILPVRTVEDLRAIYDRAEDAQEVGFPFGPDHKQSVLNVIQAWGLPTPKGAVTVSALIGAVRKQIEDGALPTEAPEESPTEEQPSETSEWATVQPGEGGQQA